MFNEQLPRWDNAGVEPPDAKKIEGWLATEKPPAPYFNWLFNRIYAALQELQEKAAEAADVDPKLANYKEEVDAASKDAAAGVYTVVNYRRLDNTLYMKATLSNKSGANYLTDTWQYYDAAGAAVVDTVIWTLTYDADGLLTSKTPNK